MLRSVIQVLHKVLDKFNLKVSKKDGKSKAKNSSPIANRVKSRGPISNRTRTKI